MSISTLRINRTANDLPADGSKRPAARNEDFGTRLSEALSESLRRLGAGPGEVRITLRRDLAGGNPAISISWGEATGRSESGSTTERNPFTGGTAIGGSRASDASASGRGRLTPGGAPMIVMNATAAANGWGYAGPAARNPYFDPAGQADGKDFVRGFENWFQDATVSSWKGAPMPLNRYRFATAEGAEEALRLVRDYAPGAQLIQQPWGSGPYIASRPMYLISLPGEKTLNAGDILYSYYSGGWGVNADADAGLQRQIRNA